MLHKVDSIFTREWYMYKYIYAKLSTHVCDSCRIHIRGIPKKLLTWTIEYIVSYFIGDSEYSQWKIGTEKLLVTKSTFGCSRDPPYGE